MSKWVVVALALLLAGCGGSDEAEASGAFNGEAFIQSVKQESQVRGALITDDGNLYIGVLDNGSDRRGYAMYVCEVAREHADGEVDRKLVKIIDIAAVARDEGFQELGSYWCEF